MVAESQSSFSVGGFVHKAMTSMISERGIGWFPQLLKTLDKCDLTGLQKFWGYQCMVFSKMKWPLSYMRVQWPFESKIPIRNQGDGWEVVISYVE